MPYPGEPPVREPALSLDAGFAAPPLPAAADKPPCTPLPALVGESPPEHTWLGTGFVWTLYMAAVWVLILPAVAIGTLAENGGWRLSDALLLAIFILLPCSLPIWAAVALAHAVRSFHRGGLGMAMLLLFVMLIGGAGMLLDADSLLEYLLGGGTIAMAAAWMRYFVSRAEDFT